MRNGPTILDGEDAVLDNHNVQRDGSVWACRYCGTTWPFPSPLPQDPGPCRPRRWGDGIEVVDGRAAEPDNVAPKLPLEYEPAGGSPSALIRACPRCNVPAGKRCIDLRGGGPYETMRPHRERR